MNGPINDTTPAGSPPRLFEAKVEGLRGIAACLVGASHLLSLSIIDPSWHPSSYLRFVECGHGAVLVFFMISGYVIGLTNQAAYSPNAAQNFLRRRSFRLLPIYLIAWFLTLVISMDHGLRSVLGSLFFLQNYDPYLGFLILPMHMNGPMWSLNYEAVYYLVFLLVWWKQPPLWTHLTAVLLLGVAGWCVPGFPVFISGYASGWIFWTFGWWLSRQPQHAPDVPSRVPILSCLLLLLATHHFASGTILLNGLHVPRADPVGMVNISNLTLFPACALCLIYATDRKIQGLSLLTFSAFAIPMATAVLLLANNRLHESERWKAAAVFAAVACLLVKFQSREWLSRFAWFGSISYGFYLIHFPMLFVVQRLPLPSGTTAAFILRATIWTGLSVGGAWVLERRLQPWVRRRFNPAITKIA